MNSRVLLTAIGLCLLLQLHGVMAFPINWDEFRFLADVHRHARGELSAPLLTFQVHFFGWLVNVGDEIAQIRAARLVMLALEAGTAMLIVAIARHFFSRPAALLAALAYVSFSFVLKHGASFRFDPLITFPVMLGLTLLVRGSLTWGKMIGAGAAIAFALMISVKAVFALPMIAAAGIFRLSSAQDRRADFVRIAGAALSSVTFLALFYALHTATLADVDSASDHLTASYQATIVEQPFLPRAYHLLQSLIENPVQWLLLLVGAVATLHSSRKAAWGRTFLLLALLTPLATVLFYRNAFPYYYAFVLAPAAILTAAAADLRGLRDRLWLAAIVLVAPALFQQLTTRSAVPETQARTIAAVHAMFPNPLSYIDRSSMIASFPQAGLFLSTVHIDAYRAAGRPMLRDLILDRQPVFLIANHPMLADALPSQPANTDPRTFLSADRQTLRQNFIPHWGPIFVAGKTLDAGLTDAVFEIMVAGPYTIEASRPLWIDGRQSLPNAVTQLDTGRHVLRSAGEAQTVTLRWGDHLKKPLEAPPEGPIFEKEL